ncbi:HAD family hydrolase [Hamadaea sp. NPDC051192]|uniref:HAD family hydrolase n=1 Tax=Hamadaea sp. NPDC051192 TaxID=3154940 RepID=UPI003418CA81
MRRAVLWDIDHTLIETRGVGRELYQAAFERVTGVPFRRAASVSGSTEFRIFSETLTLHGVPAAGELTMAYAKALAALHVERYAELRERGRALPGARNGLVALDKKGYLQTVVTGNLRAVAVIKLQAFSLDDLLNLQVGAFAEDGEDREELVRVAMTRTAADRAVLIGDTLSDVAAARANGVAVIGVASGRSSVEELRSAGADLTLADLTDLDEVIAAVDRLTTV